MPPPRPWPQTENDTIRALRAERTSWDVIAARFGVSRHSVIEHARRHGLDAFPVERVRDEAKVEARTWEPLPAFHPVSWGSIQRNVTNA